MNTPVQWVISWTYYKHLELQIKFLNCFNDNVHVTRRAESKMYSYNIEEYLLPDYLNKYEYNKDGCAILREIINTSQPIRKKLL